MSNETMNRQEIEEALETTMTGFLKMLGVTLSAEMGQTPWLNTSDGKSQQQPVIDLTDMAKRLHDLALTQEVLMHQTSHPYGLCDEQTCPPCRDQRRFLAQNIASQVESAAFAQAGTEIDKACEWGKAPELRAKLMQVLEGYRSAGRPGFDESELEFTIEPG